MEELYQENLVNFIKQSGKPWKRGSSYFRITYLKFFNRPLSAYNTKISWKRQI